MIFLEFQLQLIQRIWWWPLRSLPLRSKNRYKFLRIFPSVSLFVHVSVIFMFENFRREKGKNLKTMQQLSSHICKTQGQFILWSMNRKNSIVKPRDRFGNPLFLLMLASELTTCTINFAKKCTSDTHCPVLSTLRFPKPTCSWKRNLLLEPIYAIENWENIVKGTIDPGLEDTGHRPFPTSYLSQVKLAQLSICHICHIALRELHSYTL